MIGQDIGLPYLIPIALKVLEENFLAEGDLYKGDLISAVLTSDTNFWKSHPDHYRSLVNLFLNREPELKSSEIDWTTKKKISELFSNLQTFIEY